MKQINFSIVKSAGTNQESKELHLKWVEACRFAKVIDQALRDEEILIDKKGNLVYYNGDKSIYL